VSEAEIRSHKGSWLTDRGSLRMFSGSWIMEEGGGNFADV